MKDLLLMADHKNKPYEGQGSHLREQERWTLSMCEPGE